MGNATNRWLDRLAAADKAKGGTGSDYKLAQVLGVDRQGVPPREAQRVADMIEICREGRAPINHSLARGPWIGVELASWRSRLYGPAWREWRYDFSAPRRHRRRRLP